MSIIDDWKQKALDQVGEKSREWIESGFDKAIEKAHDQLPLPATPELNAIRKTGEIALERVSEQRENLIDLGEHGLLLALTHIANGQIDRAARDAALVKLRDQASFDEVDAAILESAAAGVEKKRKLDAAQAAVLKGLKTAFKEIGSVAAKAALPLLIAAAQDVIQGED